MSAISDGAVALIPMPTVHCVWKLMVYYGRKPAAYYALQMVCGRLFAYGWMIREYLKQGFFVQQICFAQKECWKKRSPVHERC